MTSSTAPAPYAFITPPHTPTKSGTKNSTSKLDVKVSKAASSIQFTSPDRYYPVDSSLNVQFTPGADQYAHGRRKIYKVKHVETGQAKIGMTSQSFKRRMQQHLDCARHPERDRGQGDLYEAMRRSPSKFRMGVVATLGDDCDGYEQLGEIETAVIEDHGTLHNGYNKVKGGGGGTISTEITDDELPPSSFQTPEKGYKIRYRKTNRQKKLFVDSSPKGAKKKHVVYGFRRDDGKWLIGETAQCFQKRMYGYHHAFNHPERDVGKTPLPEAVRAEPKKWKAYILYQGPRIKQME